MNYSVPAEGPLLAALTLLFPQSSKNTLRAWLKAGRIEVDGVLQTAPTALVHRHQSVTLRDKKKQIRPDLPIIYEDEDCVVVDKPCGLLSVAAAFERGETVHALLKAHYRQRQLLVVHRLDQHTSGALLFAFNPDFYERLKALFAIHAIERGYTAVVEGCFSASKGTWESYQREDRSYRVHDDAAAEQGRLAITHYRKLAASRRYSLLELKLETGRKNQIRVHCQSAGHSVVGDKKYGARTNPLKRLCLHAHLLGFQHPFTKQQMTFYSPPPDSFQRLISVT